MKTSNHTGAWPSRSTTRRTKAHYTSRPSPRPANMQAASWRAGRRWAGAEISSPGLRAEREIAAMKPSRGLLTVQKNLSEEPPMPSLSDQIAELRELRARAAAACNETSRLIRHFCEVDE